MTMAIIPASESPHLTPQNRDISRTGHEYMPQRLVIPDLFVSFLAQAPELNPHYTRVKIESEEWIKEKCSYSPKEYQRHVRADFSYFGAIFAKDAGREEFRTICDWLNWVFDFDDLFDNGCFKDNPHAARDMVGELLETMTEFRSENRETTNTPLLDIYRSVWCRIAAKVSPSARRRFFESMSSYCNGVLEQVDNDAQSVTPDLENYLAYRRNSIGIVPLLAMIEYVHGIDIPEIVFSDSSIQEIERMTVELIVLQNDVLSYPKEAAEGFSHNLVGLLCHGQNITPQQAYQQIDGLLEDRYKRWYLAQANLPRWGEKVESQVQKYLLGCQRLVQANLNWSFRSERYFGKLKGVVRETRVIPSTICVA